ncbi:flavodoxin [Bifidobacterium oedipodis]|uniref:Serine/threonine-protein kinase pkn1 n=1 Tax=Bifidobacterium oedipodis TaxID=2675322 RepID=A0A7Y0EMV8_9BIFI|nr:flavodoxin [Bifidobacterium sp. DSM 109957]NMM93194.1 serine/threonine-protein kinase pkn1 [Bifidobacterium sp. DSM 109957]
MISTDHNGNAAASGNAKLITLIASITAIALVATGIWWFAIRRTPEQSSQPTPLSNTAQHDNSGETAMMLIEGGTFTMGSPDSQRQREADETQHEVTLSDFRISPTEVTQAEYERIMGSNPSHFHGDDLPVEQVTWFDAIEYCNRLSAAEGFDPVYTVDGDNVAWDRSANGYRLPTEAEWEYAARAGTDTIFTTGDQITAADANFEGTYPYLIEENYVNHINPDVVQSENRGETIAVGSLQANAYGLYDMEGNVSEWVFDYYGEYDTSRRNNPYGPESGSLRVNRGGGYDDFAKQLRNAYRSATNPRTHDQNMGFRIARNAQPGEGVAHTWNAINITIPNNPSILVAYFSYSGNTAHAAELIANSTGADLHEIVMAEPYTGNIYEASQADLNNNVRPALADHVNNMDRYDVILLGYPTWWSTMPMPVSTFLESYDLSGKTIIPFSSNGGTRFGDSISDLAKQAPGALIGQGFEFTYSGGSDLTDNINTWLSESGLA